MKITEITVARNSALNLLGFILPLIVAVFAIPIAISGYGLDKFGIITLTWALIGYFSLFDLGISRALTQTLSERLGLNEHDDIETIIWTGLSLLILLGLIGGLTLYSLAETLVSTLNMPLVIQNEAAQSFKIIAIAIPFVILSSGLLGILSAYQRFDIVNSIRAPLGVLLYLMPVLTLQLSTSLSLAIAGLIATRILFTAIYIFYARKISGISGKIAPSWIVTKQLLRFGGWMTISNIISPLMVYVDRFIIGARLSTAHVALYTTPYEMVTRLWIIPSSLISALFPAFSATHKKRPNDLAHLMRLGSLSIIFIIFPITLSLVTFSREILELWLGADFAKESHFVLQCLAIGVFTNSYAQILFALIQGIGRPDITAKMHIFELPFYLALVYILLDSYGINGVALAWVARMIMDLALLMLISSRMVNNAGKIITEQLLLLISCIAVLFMAMTNIIATNKYIYLAIFLATFFTVSWAIYLPKEIKQSIRDKLNNQLPR